MLLEGARTHSGFRPPKCTVRIGGAPHLHGNREGGGVAVARGGFTAIATQCGFGGRTVWPPLSVPLLVVKLLSPLYLASTVWVPIGSEAMA